jgi:glycosyltransferase involved in cell wall biosynthesis
MKILLNFVHLVSDRLGGSWIYSYNLLKGLVNVHGPAGITVLTNPTTSERIRSSGVAVQEIPLDATSRIRRVLWEQRELAGYVESIRPDVFHGVGNTIPLNLRCPTVVTIHDFQYEYFPGNFPLLRRLYLSLIVPRSLRSASAAIAISQATKDDAVQFTHVDGGRVSVIYEAGLTDSERELDWRKIDLVEKFGIRQPFLLTVGSLLPHKNMKRLIEAFARMAPKIPHDLVVVGEPFGRSSDLEETVRRSLAMNAQRVRQIGFVERPELLALYRAADVYIFPSLFEGFGIPALEAMECGCPVAASGISCLREIIGDAGVYFDPLHPEDISKKILDLLASRDERDRLKEAGGKRASMYSWDNMARETLRVYEQVLRKK